MSYYIVVYIHSNSKNEICVCVRVRACGVDISMKHYCRDPRGRKEELVVEG